MMRSSDMTRMFQRIVHAIRPARQTNTPDETGNITRLQAKFNDFDIRELNSMQVVGLASATPVGTDLMVINVAGDNSNGVIVASNHQTHRPKNLATGECVLYDCAATQQSVHLKADGSIVLTGFHKIMLACDTEIDITAPLVKVVGNLQVTGSITGGQGGGDQVGLQSHIHSFGGAAPLAGS